MARARAVSITAAAGLMLLAFAMPPAAFGSTTVPLRIHASYVANPSPDVSCNGFRITSSGTANGDPIGSTGSYSDSECADVVAEPGAFTIRDGAFEITTPSGALSGTYSGKAGLPDSAFNVFPSGDFTITGGTGSFSGASGGGIFYARPNLITGNTTAEFAGTLTTP